MNSENLEYIGQFGLAIGLGKAKENKAPKVKKPTLTKDSPIKKQKAMPKEESVVEEEYLDDESFVIQKITPRPISDSVKRGTITYASEDITESVDSYQDAVEEAKTRRLNPNMRAFKMSPKIFINGSSKLTPEATRRIKKLAEEILNEGYNSIVIEGHYDDANSRGEAVSIELSRLRAKAVFDEFIKYGFVNISYLGLGSFIPIADNETAVGRIKNRRIEVYIE
jgi:outer membrane protein OmpA-like peptidoglycan-associated protein